MTFKIKSKTDIQKGRQKCMPKSGIQKWHSTVTTKFFSKSDVQSDLQKWPVKFTSKSDQMWRPKVISKSDIQQWHPK